MSVTRQIGILMALTFFNSTLTYASDFQDIVINEIAWSGTQASFSDEWIELYNNTDKSVNLGKWKLQTGRKTISLTGVILAEGYFLVENDENTISDVAADLVDKEIVLLNIGGKLILENPKGKEIDIVGGEGMAWYAGNKDKCYSMERKNPKGSGTDTSNWADNNGIVKNGKNAEGGFINGTPKIKNSIFREE